jgi:hypothetical protein
MKRTLLVVAVALGALTAAGIAWSSGVLGGGPAQIRIYGGGQIGTPTIVPRTFSLEASANPDGLGAHGSLRFAGPPPGTQSDITCLSVAGNTAIVGGFVREEIAGVSGRDFLFAVTDNGPPGSGVDRSGFEDVSPELDNPPYPGLPPGFPRTCPAAADFTGEPFGVFPVTGDVSIERP